MNIPLYVIYVHCSPLSNNMKTSFRSERKSLESGQLSCNWLVYQQGTNGDPRFNLLLQCRSVTSDRLSQIITTERPLSSYWKKKYTLGLLITIGYNFIWEKGKFHSWTPKYCMIFYRGILCFASNRDWLTTECYGCWLFLLTKSMLMTRSCCSLMLPFGPFIFLTFTEVTGGLAFANFGTFFTFLLVYKNNVVEDKTFVRHSNF